MSGSTATPRCLCGYEDEAGEGGFWRQHEAIWPDLQHGRRRVTAQTVAPRQDWVDAYTGGATIPAIAREHSTYPKRVRAHLRAAGVVLRDDRATHSGGANRLTADDLDLRRAEELYASGLSWRAVAGQLGVALTTLHRHRREES